ncbi:hypothetical protein BKA61DRAFT_338708 [Leptodontidium sp. MPI-SDFR-AT-0119]|nr:hypothetical protein BKA61DRAFT_338708 [Leptodontidium sp. MPI-SDFR-AT-0119]
MFFFPRHPQHPHQPRRHHNHTHTTRREQRTRIDSRIDSMPHFWVPRGLLGVDPSESGFTCTAIVKPKKKKGQPQEGHRRCSLTMFSNESKAQACRVLDTLAQIDVVSESVSEGMGRVLVRVAELTSCPRWHRKPGHSQAEAVAAKWKGIIHLFVANEIASIRRAGRERVRVVPVPVPSRAPRSEQELFVPRRRVRSVPDSNVHEQRPIVERASRRARENVSFLWYIPLLRTHLLKGLKRLQHRDISAPHRPREQQQPSPQMEA